jgi:hypothetical protein
MRMSSVGPLDGLKMGHASNRLAVVTAIEVSLTFAAILSYIWRWQHSHPLLWIPLLAWIFMTHFLHHDTLRGLGLGLTGLRSSAEWLFPIAILLYLPLLADGISHHELSLLHPTWRSLLMFLGYGIWCAFQQYLAQSYFHNRFALIIRNAHLRCVVVGILFGATHLPNLILTIATLVAGFVFAEAFARYRNIWPLAFAQAVGGILLAAVAPDALIHHMRVGPGYFFYGIR